MSFPNGHDHDDHLISLNMLLALLNFHFKFNVNKCFNFWIFYHVALNPTLNTVSAANPKIKMLFFTFIFSWYKENVSFVGIMLTSLTSLQSNQFEFWNWIFAHHIQQPWLPDNILLINFSLQPKISSITPSLPPSISYIGAALQSFTQTVSTY